MNLTFIVKAAVSVGFLLFLIIKIDIGLLVSHLSSIDPGYYVVSFLLLIVNVILLAVKYNVVMAPTGIHRSVIQLIKINFICRFYSMFLSSAVGQSVIRWYYTTKNADNRFRFVAALFFERISFVFAIAGFLLFSIPYMPPQIDPSVRSRILFAIALIPLFTLIYYGYLLHAGLQSSINRIWMSVSNRFRQPTADRIRWLIDSFSIYCNHPKTLFLSVALAFLWHSAFLLRVYFLTCSLDVSLTIAQLAWMASVVLLFQSIPLTFNGIGIREGAYAFFFQLQGLPPEKGASLGILLFTQILLVSTIGGLIHWFSKQ